MSKICNSLSLSILLFSALPIYAEKPPPKYPVVTQLHCRQWVDPTIPCCVGKKGDVFTFFLTIQNKVKAKRVSIQLEADEDPSNYKRVLNGFEVLEITPIKSTPLKVGESVEVKVVIRLNSDQWQEIKINTLTHGDQKIDHVCSDYLSFNDPNAVRRARKRGTDQ